MAKKIRRGVYELAAGFTWNDRPVKQIVIDRVATVAGKPCAWVCFGINELAEVVELDVLRWILTDAKRLRIKV